MHFLQFYCRISLDCISGVIKMYTIQHDILIKNIDSPMDRLFIPMDPNNKDYQEYLKWLEEGNEPLPADE